MTGEMQAFIDELRADARFATVAEELEQAAAAVYAEGCEVVDAVEFFDALCWIAAQARTINDRLEAMRKIGALKGRVHISSLRDFLGWKNQ